MDSGRPVCLPLHGSWPQPSHTQVCGTFLLCSGDWYESFPRAVLVFSMSVTGLILPGIPHVLAELVARRLHNVTFAELVRS